MDDGKQEKTNVPWKIFITDDFENPLLSRIGWEGLRFHRKLYYVHFMYAVIQMFSDCDGVRLQPQEVRGLPDASPWQASWTQIGNWKVVESPTGC